MHRTRIASLLATVITLALVVGTAQAQTRDLSALETFPVESEALVLFPSLQGLHDAAARMNGALGLSNQFLGDLTGSFETVSGMSAGLDREGTVAISLSGLQGLIGGGDVQALALLPVTSYEAFIAGLGGSAAETGVTEVTLPTSGETLYVRRVGDHALMGSEVAPVTDFAPAAGPNATEALGVLGRSYAEHSDAVLVMNFRNTRDGLRTLLSQGVAAYSSLMESAGAAAGVGGMMTMYGGLADTLLRDIDTLVVGVDIGSEGIGFTTAVSFTPGSPLAGAFGPSGPGAPMLRGLPARPWVFAMGMDLSGMQIGPLIGEYEPTGDADVDGWSRIYRQGIEAFRGVENTAGAWYFGSFTPGAVTLDMLALYGAPEPSAYVDRLEEYYRGIDGLSLSLGSYPDSSGAVVAHSMVYDSEFERNVSEIAGQPAHRYRMSTNFSDPEMAAMAGGMSGMTNQEGLLTTVGSSIVLATGTEREHLEATIAGLAAGVPGLSEDPVLTDLRSHAIIPDPAGEVYMRLDGVVAALSGFAPAPETAAGEAQPAAFFLHSASGETGARAYVPYAAIVSGIEAFSRIEAVSPM